MAKPSICGRCNLRNSFRAVECRHCGAQLCDIADGPRRTPGVRIAAADWRTQDLHRAWAEATPDEGFSAVVDAHQFLEYARLLRDVASDFTQRDNQTWFDGCAFFLRGGFPVTRQL